MERLRKELVGGWGIKAWLHRFTTSTKPGIFHWIPAKDVRAVPVL